MTANINHPIYRFNYRLIQNRKKIRKKETMEKDYYFCEKVARQQQQTAAQKPNTH